MKSFAQFIGILLLIPIALVLVILAIVTMIGGYLSFVIAEWGTELLITAAIILAFIFVIKVIKRFL